jgi:Radical SAM superfamily.
LQQGEIHKFEMQGTRLVLDIHSGSLHQVDEVVWDLLDYGADGPGEADLAALRARHGAEAVAEAMAEVEWLKAQGVLFAPPPDWEPVMPKPGDPLRAICLNVAHACNLKCTYCFACDGTYGGPAKLMPFEVARQAVDLLIRLSGARPACEIDFFGGEPLLNWRVVKQTIAYAREAGRKAGKSFTFTLTTNAMLLTPEILDELDREQVSLILSLDGRPEVHDAKRCGSHAPVERAIRMVLDRRAPGGRPAWEYGAAQGASGRGAYAVVRGTYTADNLDFAEDALYMMEHMQSPHFSLEPVVATPDEPYALREEHLPRLLAEYERLALEVDRRRREGRPVTFHHFAVESETGPCLPRRVQGCGAGVQYLAVTPEGDLYPCHQFVGREQYRLGNVTDGIVATDLQARLAGCHIYTKRPCPTCWARYYCSGGCHANADLLSGDIFQPDPIGCALTKKRVECGLWLKARALMDAEAEPAAR